MSDRYENVVIPRCNVFLAEERADGTFGPERHMGLCPEVTMSTAIEEAELRDPGSPTSRLVKKIVTSVERTLAITAQEVTARNLARFIGGSSEVFEQSASSVEDEPLDTAVIEGGAIYQLGATDSNPAGARMVKDVVLSTDSETYEADKDYEVDAEKGRVFIPLGSACIGEEVTASYDVEEATWDRVASLDASITRRGRLRIIEDNVGGASRDYYLPLVEIRPEGDISFTSESDWQSVQFAVTALTPEGPPGQTLPGLYIDGKPQVVA